MAMMTLQQAFAWIHAREPRACLVGEGATPLARVHTDSRTLQSEQQLLTLTLEEALAVYAHPKYGARGASSALKEF